MRAVRQFADAGISAVFEEASGGGDIFDLASLRNRPAASPADWLANILFHSDHDYYQVAAGPTSVAVTHAAVAGASTAVVSFWGGTGQVVRTGQIVTAHIDLVTHDLGYVPKYIVVAAGEIVAPGTLVQSPASQSRIVTPYATSSKIRLMDVGISSGSALPSLAKDYVVVVFRQPAASGDQLVNFDPANGRARLGREKFDSDLKMLRQSGAGDSPLGLLLGPSAHIRNGAARTVLASGTTVTETGYGGSFAGSAGIDCTVE